MEGQRAASSLSWTPFPGTADLFDAYSALQGFGQKDSLAGVRNTVIKGEALGRYPFFG